MCVFCLQVSSTSDEQQSESPTHFPCCCKQFRSFVLNTLHSISLHSVWQVRSFVDTSFVGDHSFPCLKQSLVPRLSFYFAPLIETAQSSGFTSQPSFRSIRYSPFGPHSLNPFRNHTAANLYGSQITALAPFFGSPVASFHTCEATASVNHEKPQQHNLSVHPGKLLKPPHFPVDVHL